MKLFDSIRPRSLATLGLFGGLAAIAADHIQQTETPDHKLTLSGVAFALAMLLIRVLADQNKGFSVLRGHNAKQDQQINALIAQAIQQDPTGPVARLLQVQGQSSEFKVRE